MINEKELMKKSPAKGSFFVTYALKKLIYSSTSQPRKRKSFSATSFVKQ